MRKIIIIVIIIRKHNKHKLFNLGEFKKKKIIMINKIIKNKQKSWDMYFQDISYCDLARAKILYNVLSKMLLTFVQSYG